MAKKITIQHLYTTGTTAAPAASALTLGEIAISAGKDKEGIYFKNNNNEVVKVLTSAQTRTMILETAGSVEGFNDHVTHLANNKTAYEGNNPYGHVKLVDGDLSTINHFTDGDAASSYHFHKQYYSFLDSGKGLTTIIDNVNHPNEIGFGIDDATYNKITGATPSSTFNTHTGNTTVHITGEERTNWNNATNRINTFLDVETGATAALDSLHEIQEYLTGSGNSVNTLLESLNDLTDTVSGNTDDITSLKQKFESNGIVSVLQNEVERKVETVDASGNLSAVTGTTATGVKKYTITHTTAGAQTSEIKATNDISVIPFGSNFKIVDKIAYDANGHVVSGSTQTLTLPSILTATTDNYGVVKLKSGQLTLEDELLNNEDFSRTAAGVAHGHTEYVKLTDLYSGNTSSNITISCGTY